MSDEFEKPISQFRYDMLQAFRHGIEYEHVGHENDLAEETKDKHLPFAEWFSRHYQERDTSPAPEKADADVTEAWDVTAANWRKRVIDTSDWKNWESKAMHYEHVYHLSILANDRLRADLATVTAERDSKIAEALSHHADAIKLLDERDHALKIGMGLGSDLEAEREDADRLAAALWEDAEHIHIEEGHVDGFMECDNLMCSDEIKLLAAHDARRADGGGA